MYTVETKHHTKDYRNGDLESKLELLEAKHFKTRKEAKEYIESKVSGKKNVERHYHTGDTDSTVIYFTGMKWTHENTGQELHEYYAYKMFKARFK